MTVTTQGIVLKELKINDRTTVVTLLTDKCGKLSAYINNSTRLRNKMGSSTDLLCYSNFVLFKSKDTWYINSADKEKVFFGIRTDIKKLALATYMAEMEKELAPEGENAKEYLRLILNCIYFLDRGTKSLQMIKSIFELRILSLAGYMPDLTCCCKCGNYEDKAMYFSCVSGTLCCISCSQEREPNSVLVPFSVVYAMRHIIYTDFEKVFSFKLGEDSTSVLANVSEQYCVYQLERTFNSLEFYKSV